MARNKIATDEVFYSKSLVDHRCEKIGSKEIKKKPEINIAVLNSIFYELDQI